MGEVRRSQVVEARAAAQRAVLQRSHDSAKDEEVDQGAPEYDKGVLRRRDQVALPAVGVPRDVGDRRERPVQRSHRAHVGVPEEVQEPRRVEQGHQEDAGARVDARDEPARHAAHAQGSRFDGAQVLQEDAAHHRRPLQGRGRVSHIRRAHQRVARPLQAQGLHDGRAQGERGQARHKAEAYRRQRLRGLLTSRAHLEERQSNQGQRRANAHRDLDCICQGTR